MHIYPFGSPGIQRTADRAKKLRSVLRWFGSAVTAASLSTLFSTLDAGAQIGSPKTLDHPATTTEQSDLSKASPNTALSESTTPATSKLLQGGIRYTVPEGTPIKLKIATVPTNGMKLLDRDLDGNLYPAKLGQEITAKITEDLYVDDNKVIPEGSIFHGRVSKILPPRRVRRPGSLVISFDQLTTPDGRKFAFGAQANDFKPSTAKSKAKGFGIIAAHAAGGAIVGALVAYEIFGLRNTIAMHGYNIAGGAAGGALLATGFAIMKKGPNATLEPGDDLNMAFNSDLLMPAAVEPMAKAHPRSAAGLNIQILKTKMIKDGLEGSLLRMDVQITNDSNRTFKSIDLFIEDSEGKRSPLCGGVEDDSDFLFEVEPQSTIKTRLYFLVEYPKLKQTLVWLNHHSRQVCYRGKCP